MKLLSSAAVRRCIIAEDGHHIISADFDQIELRVVAGLAQETEMIEAAKKGISLHKLAAERLYGSNYTPDEYKYAKNNNFTWVYGGGAAKMARQYKISLTQAQDIQARYSKQFPALVEYKRVQQELVLRSALGTGADYRRYKLLRQAMFETKGNVRLLLKEKMDNLCKGKFGYVYTPFGRRLIVDAIKPYAVVNYIVQSTSRDIMAHALLRVMGDRRLEPYVLLPIHDEILGQAPIQSAQWTVDRLARVMSSKDGLPLEFMGVPITASGKVLGRSWGHGYLN